LEAKWYYSGYTPSLQEYIENAWISISAPTILVHAFFFVTNPITKEAMVCLEEYPNIIRWSSMILRLADDLGTSSVLCKPHYSKSFVMNIAFNYFTQTLANILIMFAFFGKSG
jgi:hypothetical protein